MSLRHSRWLLVVATVGACLLLIPAAWAQSPQYQIGYYSNNNNTSGLDQEVRIIDPNILTSGGACAMLYVFDQYQNLKECCGCYVTINGLLELSVHTNLLADPFDGIVPNSGNIKLLSAEAYIGPAGVPVCDPTGIVEPVTLESGLVAWSTHLPGKTAADGNVTEDEFTPATLSYYEQLSLEQQCGGIVLDGSGDGVCSGNVTSSTPLGCTP
jgi:hypothetical protein